MGIETYIVLVRYYVNFGWFLLRLLFGYEIGGFGVLGVWFQSYKVKLAICHLEFFSVISFSWVIWKSSSNLWHLAEYLFLFGLSWLVEEMGIFDYKRHQVTSCWLVEVKFWLY